MYNDVFAIILAGGKGTRFGGDTRKQFLMFHGKELWRHIYDTVISIIPKRNVVIVGVDIPGGQTRSDSVKKGLEWVNEVGEGIVNRVVCFEAARPLVTKEQIKQIIDDKSPSCCFVNPVVDTLILTDKTYLNRSECRHLVSPQAFNYEMLYKAYLNSNLSEAVRTDDTRLMYETYGIKPNFLEGGENLYKVTYPKDIVVLEEIWKQLQLNDSE